MVDVGVDVQLTPVGIDRAALVGQLLEFNAYEHSVFDGADVDHLGRFGYRYLDLYWSDPTRHAYLIETSGCTAGLVLIREGAPHSIAEFLVLPKHRRAGVGSAAARAAFAAFPGDWEVHQVRGNNGAIEFWRRAIPVPFDQTVDSDGTTQHFSIPG